MNTWAEVIIFLENVLFAAPINAVKKIVKAFKEPYNVESSDDSPEQDS